MMNASTAPSPEEPWLRGTFADVPAVPRAVLHSLIMAHEDLEKWCAELSDHALNVKPGGLPAIAFQVRHICRSMDRLLTYAEGRSLEKGQLEAMKSESQEGATREALFRELTTAITTNAARVHALAAQNLEEPRVVGKKRLLTTLGGLFLHIAEHTQRHVGQAITTAKLVAGC